ncbi:hypothetical protein A2U01_0015258, partial [Trifolium medium]|nr:hypothetical protein [Trifolium medium]
EWSLLIAGHCRDSEQSWRHVGYSVWAQLLPLALIRLHLKLLVPLAAELQNCLPRSAFFPSV